MHIEKGSIIIMTKINETAPRPGKTIYGASLGILSLDTKFPRIHGDIGNAETWPFPVLYKIVEGASPDMVVRKGAKGLKAGDMDRKITSAEANPYV